MLLSFVSLASAYPTLTEKYLPRLQGQWYDLNGNVVLNFAGNYLNDCQITGLYGGAGGGGDIGFTVRIIENGQYRDLQLSCTNLSENPDAYHQYIVFNKNTLRRTPEAQFYESVGGLGLGMSQKDVVVRYGQPNRAYSGSNDRRLTWEYTDLGMTITWDYGIISRIVIYKYGNRRFDRTGFNCLNTVYDYAQEYGMKRVPSPGRFGAFGIGYNEFMWFEHYPNAVELSLYWN